MAMAARAAACRATSRRACCVRPSSRAHQSVRLHSLWMISVPGVAYRMFRTFPSLDEASDRIEAFTAYLAKGEHGRADAMPDREPRTPRVRERGARGIRRRALLG